jgi:large conductance mechanosensitive channel
MKNFFNEFKKFAVKGNMIDLAIGVVIGAAFNKIVDVLVKKIITPPLGYLTSGVDLADMAWTLKEPVIAADGTITNPGVVLGYGAFIEAMMDFLIVALTLFIVIKAVNTLKEKAEDEGDKTVPTPKDIQLLSDIREEMRKMNGRISKEASPTDNQ